jgi:hypothetical protein
LGVVGEIDADIGKGVVAAEDNSSKGKGSLVEETECCNNEGE